MRDLVGDDAAHDRSDGAPGDPQEPADHAEGGLLGEPPDDVLEVAGKTRARPRPGDRLGHHPLTAGAAEAAQLALQEAAGRAQVEVPPATPLAPVVARPTQTAAARTDEPPRPPAQRHDHPLALEADRDHARARDLQQTIECRADAHLRLLVGAGIDTASLRAARCASLSYRPVTADPAQQAATTAVNPPDHPHERQKRLESDAHVAFHLLADSQQG